MSNLRKFFIKYNKPTTMTSQKCEARDALLNYPINTLKQEGLEHIIEHLTEDDITAIREIAKKLIKVSGISDVPAGFSGLIDYLETGKDSSQWQDDSIVI